MTRTTKTKPKPAAKKAAQKPAKKVAAKPPKDTTPIARPSRAKSGKPTAPPMETAAGTPGFGEAPQAGFTATYDPEAGFGAGSEKLPALRSVAPRPEDFSPSASLNAILAAPDQRSDKAKGLLAMQPMIASHPLVAGTLPEYKPHRPERPSKSEGGVRFKITSPFEPKGDQPQAIEELVEGVDDAERDQVLLGVTGSGKTFTMAHVIERRSARR